MDKRIILILLVSVVACLSAKAQKSDTSTYYVRLDKSFSKLVKSKDSADFYRVIYPADTTEKGMFIVKDYYINNRLKLTGKSTTQRYYLHREGTFTEFYPNGQRKAVENYKDNYLSGEVTKYFANGELYISENYDKGLVKIIECRDSTGKLLVEKGNGHCVELDYDLKNVVAEGLVVDSLQTGEWHGYPRDSLKYVCIYDKGIIKKGTSYFRGKTYSFTQLEAEPQYKDGMAAFYKLLAKNVRYPKAAKENNIQGKVILSFTINDNGTLTDARVVRGIGSGCDEEALKALKLSPPWIPGYQYGIPVRVQYSVPVGFSLSSN